MVIMMVQINFREPQLSEAESWFAPGHPQPTGDLHGAHRAPEPRGAASSATSTCSSGWGSQEVGWTNGGFQLVMGVPP